MRGLPLISAAILLSACAAQKGGHTAYLQRRGIAEISLDQFAHCRGYGCKFIDQVSLNKKQWRRVTSPFAREAKNATQERKQIAQSIALFEQEIGKMTGTADDQYGTFMQLGEYQLDCIDESTNTTIYLNLLEKRGLMKFHATSSPEVRVPLIHSGRWPHQTATIIETATNERFAVDSWFHDNGVAPEIMPIKTWKDGWNPEEHIQNNQ